MMWNPRSEMQQVEALKERQRAKAERFQNFVELYMNPFWLEKALGKATMRLYVKSDIDRLKAALIVCKIQFPELYQAYQAWQ